MHFWGAARQVHCVMLCSHFGSTSDGVHSAFDQGQTPVLFLTVVCPFTLMVRSSPTDTKSCLPVADIIPSLWTAYREAPTSQKHCRPRNKMRSRLILTIVTSLLCQWSLVGCAPKPAPIQRMVETTEGRPNWTQSIWIVDVPREFVVDLYRC